MLASVVALQVESTGRFLVTTDRVSPALSQNDTADRSSATRARDNFHVHMWKEPWYNESVLTVQAL